MAKIPSKHSRDLPQDFEGLLNNLQDWELNFKEKDKKLRADAVGKGKVDTPGQPSGNNVSQISGSARVNGKQTKGKTLSSDNADTVRQYDYLKEYESLSRLSSGVPSQEGFVDANSEKELGNEYFKQKKFSEAIDCYSRSIALSPTAVAYANRAMAYIKIKRFQDAENDCTEALNLDDRYIKAYSRRSTARKELRKLKESIDDAEFAMRLEPQNQEIKKQYAECKSMLEKEILKKASGAVEGARPVKSEVDMKKPTQKVQSVSTSSPALRVAEFGKNDSKEILKKASGAVEGARPVKSEVDMKKPTQKVQSVSTSSPALRVAEFGKNDSKGIIREVGSVGTSMKDKGNNILNDGARAGPVSEVAKRKPENKKQELRASVQELATKAANLAKIEAAKNIVPPNSAYEFEVSWRGLSGDRNLQSRLLKVTSPIALPGIFKNALSATLLIDIIRCIATFFTEDMALAVEYLKNLPKIPRFGMIIMCLSSSDKADLAKIWNEVLSGATSDYADILQNLRSIYGIKQ